MDDSPLTGAQRAHLRGLGQRLEAALKLGREGASAAVASELDRLLHAHELVKIRFLGADRQQRAALCDAIEKLVQAECVGTVGHTALFYRRNEDPAERQIALPA